MIFPSIPQVTNLVFTRHSNSIPFAEHIFQIHIFTTCFTGKIQRRPPLFWEHRQSWYFFSISLWLQRGPKPKKPSSNSPPIIRLGPKEPHHYQVRKCHFYSISILNFSLWPNLYLYMSLIFVAIIIQAVFIWSQLNSKLNNTKCSFWRFLQKFGHFMAKKSNISWIKLTVESFKAHEFHA